MSTVQTKARPTRSLEYRPGMRPVTGMRMTFEEWIAHEVEGPLVEWVDGELLVHMAPTIVHQRVIGFLALMLGQFVRIRRLGELLFAPVAVRAMPDGPGRLPDLVFVASQGADMVGEKYIAGPPDLVIEVISDDSVGRDGKVKLAEYEASAIREYWVIDPRPRHHRAQFYVQDEAGRYRLAEIGDDGIFHSSVLNDFWLRVDWLWHEDANPLAALAEMVGLDAVVAAAGGRG